MQACGSEPTRKEHLDEQLARADRVHHGELQRAHDVQNSVTLGRADETSPVRHLHASTEPSLTHQQVALKVKVHIQRTAQAIR